MRSLETELLDILDSNSGEREIHCFLKKNKKLIEMAFNRAWNFHICVPEFRLGSDFRSDFLILSSHSANWHGIFIELKSFNSKLYNSNGFPTKPLQQAKQQIASWKEWIRINEQYLRSCFAKILDNNKAPAIWPLPIEHYSKGYSSGAAEISDMRCRVEYYYHIVIGRSSTLTPKERELRSNDTAWGGPEIATYDRLLTMAKRLDGVRKS